MTQRCLALRRTALALITLLAGCVPPPAAAPTGDASVSAIQGERGRRAPATEKRFVEAIRPNPPGVRVLVTVFETAVGASTRQEFLDNIKKEQDKIRGRREGAQQLLSSRWSMRWTWQTEAAGNLCVFRSVTVFLDYQAHYVRLGGTIADDPEIQAWWAAQSQRAYDRHLVHLTALRNAMAGTQRKLQNLTGGTCTLLGTEANSVARRELNAIAERLGMSVYLDP